MMEKQKRLIIQNASLLTLLVVGLILRFYPFILGMTIFFGDNYSLMVPGKVFTAGWIRQGILPMWNPNIFGGVPWLGNMNESIFYPSTLIFAILNPGAALNLTVILHLVVTFVGMYQLARVWTKNKWASLVAAILWTFSTQVTGAMNNLTTLQSITWVPWVLFASLKLDHRWQSKISLAVFIFLQMLGGYPQFIFYSVIAGGVLSLWQASISLKSWREWGNWLLNWIITGIITLGISAFVWLPFVEYLTQSTRTIQSQTQSMAGSLHLPELIKIVLPYFFDNPAAGIKWGPNWNGMPNLAMYVTWLGLFLIVLAVVTRKLKKSDYLLAAILVFSLLFSLGDKIPGFKLFQVLLPLFKASRGPSLILAVTNALAALWIGDLMARLKLQLRTYRWLLGIAGAIFAVLVLAYFLSLFQFDQIWTLTDALLKHKLTLGGFHTLAKDKIIFDSILINAVVNLGCLAAGLYFWNKKLWMALLFVLVVDMHWNTAGMLFFGPSNLYPTWGEIIAAQNDKLHQVVGHERILTSDFNVPYTDFGAYWEALTVRQPFSDSYIRAEEMKNYELLRQLRLGAMPDWNMTTSLSTLNGYVSLLPQDFNQAWNDPAEDPGINRVSEIKINDSRLSQWGTKYYLLDSWYPNAPQNLAYNKVWDGGRWQLYELPWNSRFQFDGTVSDVGITENPNKLKVTVNNIAAKSLIVASRYDDNWRADVNGKAVDILSRDGLRGVPLTPGKTTVTFSYRPRLFFWGLAVSGLTCLSVLAAFLIQRKLFSPNSK